MTDLLARLIHHWYRFVDWLNQETDYIYDWDLIHEPVAEEDEDE
jgi:hypothetical protein